MGRKLSLPDDTVRVVFNGITLDGYQKAESAPARPSPPSLGFFARMCKEKGLDTLVDAYILLRKRGNVKEVKLRIGGGCGPGDEPFVNALRDRLSKAGLLGDVEFHPNLDRKAKVDFLQSLTVFSVPALYGEAFGLYLVEAMAAGVPVVQPRSGSFPEIVEASGAGVICEPGNAQALALAAEQLLLNPDQARAMGDAGRHAVREKFSAEAMARATWEIYRDVADRKPQPAELKR